MALNVGQMVSEPRRMTVTELRSRYTEVFGEQTRSHHKDYLIRRIAWRAQANAEGWLPDRARKGGSVVPTPLRACAQKRTIPTGSASTGCASPGCEQPLPGVAPPAATGPRPSGAKRPSPPPPLPPLSPHHHRLRHRAVRHPHRPPPARGRTCRRGRNARRRSPALSGEARRHGGHMVRCRVPPVRAGGRHQAGGQGSRAGRRLRRGMRCSPIPERKSTRLKPRCPRKVEVGRLKDRPGVSSV